MLNQRESTERSRLPQTWFNVRPSWVRDTIHYYAFAPWEKDSETLHNSGLESRTAKGDSGHVNCYNLLKPVKIMASSLHLNSNASPSAAHERAWMLPISNASKPVPQTACCSVPTFENSLGFRNGSRLQVRSSTLMIFGNLALICRLDAPDSRCDSSTRIWQPNSGKNSA